MLNTAFTFINVEESVLWKWKKKLILLILKKNKSATLSTRFQNLQNNTSRLLWASSSCEWTGLMVKLLVLASIAKFLSNITECSISLIAEGGGVWGL